MIKIKIKIKKRGQLRMLHGLETHGGLAQESCGLVLERNRDIKQRHKTEK
jgi:hypothetical protein